MKRHSNSVLKPYEVRRLARNARKHELNRQVSEEVLKNLDPDGFSIYSMIIPFHDRGIVGDIPHHRVRAQYKMKGTVQPIETFVDVLSTDWDKLTEAVPRNAQDRG